MSDLLGGQVGDVKYDLAFANGKLQLSGMFSSGGADIGLNVALDAKIFLDKLKVLIPGSIDDAIINGIESMLPASAPQA